MKEWRIISFVRERGWGRVTWFVTRERERDVDYAFDACVCENAWCAYSRKSARKFKWEMSDRVGECLHRYKDRIRVWVRGRARERDTGITCSSGFHIWVELLFPSQTFFSFKSFQFIFNLWRGLFSSQNSSRPIVTKERRKVQLSSPFIATFHDS